MNVMAFVTETVAGFAVGGDGSSNEGNGDCSSSVVGTDVGGDN